MKKFILICAVLFGTTSFVNAQTAYEKAKFFDNWSVGVTAGVSSPMDFNKVTPFNTNFGVKVQKDFTPETGIQIEGLAFTNGNHFSNSGTWVKAVDVNASWVLNWSNIIGGYKGSPRFFEVSSVTGLGWLYDYGTTYHYLSSKTGVDFAFNFGKTKTHSLVLTPAVYWNLGSLNDKIQFNKNHAQLAINASYVYHFKNSNRTHSFKKYDIGALNSEISNLRSELAKKPKVIVKEIVKTDTISRVIENNYTVSFTKGNSSVGDVTSIVSALKNSDSKITIIGGVSPEGSESYNKNLALKRAESVKEALVKSGISADRITVINSYDSQRRATVVINQ